MNDVREAAERLRRVIGCYGASLPMPVDEPLGTDNLYWADCCNVIHAYLAEHLADDDEVITEEWLRSVATDIHKALNQLAFGCRAPNVARIICWPADDCFQWFIDENGANPIPIKPPATRGDLRQLCRALGIELKETQC